MVPSYHAWDPPELYQAYFYRILESDLMPLVHGIAWHPFLVNLDPEECGGAFFDHYFCFERSCTTWARMCRLEPS